MEVVGEVDPAEAGGEQDGAGVVGQVFGESVGVGVEAVPGAVDGVGEGVVEQAAADGVGARDGGQGQFADGAAPSEVGWDEQRAHRDGAPAWFGRHAGWILPVEDWAQGRGGRPTAPPPGSHGPYCLDYLDRR